jgi:hypothetical protein
MRSQSQWAGITFCLGESKYNGCSILISLVAGASTVSLWHMRLCRDAGLSVGARRRSPCDSGSVTRVCSIPPRVCIKVTTRGAEPNCQADVFIVIDFVGIILFIVTNFVGCPSRKSYPRILMMQAGQNGRGDNGSASLDRPPQRRILVQ